MRTAQDCHQVEIIGRDLGRRITGSEVQPAGMLARIQHQELGGTDEDDHVRDRREAELDHERVDALLHDRRSNILRDL